MPRKKRFGIRIRESVEGEGFPHTRVFEVVATPHYEFSSEKINTVLSEILGNEHKELVLGYGTLRVEEGQKADEKTVDEELFALEKAKEKAIEQGIENPVLAKLDNFFPTIKIGQKSDKKTLFDKRLSGLGLAEKLVFCIMEKTADVDVVWFAGPNTGAYQFMKKYGVEPITERGKYKIHVLGKDEVAEFKKRLLVGLKEKELV